MKASVQRFLACWGNGQFGRLGHSGGSSELFPRVVAALGSQQPKQVSCGGAHTAVVTDDGALYTFGINGHGQLGHNDDLKHVAEPTEVILPDSIQAVSAGETHTLCLSGSGEVWSCGSNGDGQLGLGDQHGIKNAEFRLVRALAGKRIKQVAAGHQHSLALADDGQVFAWGHGGYGALGLGPGHTRWEAQPRPITALKGVKVKHIAAGAFHSGCVDDEGQAYTWGHGGYWQLGLGVAAHECYPQQLPMLRLVSQLVLGFSHSMSIGNFGQTFLWGTDEHGSLGMGRIWPKVGAKTPSPLKLHLAAGAAGWQHSLGVDEQGRLYSWGWGGAVGAGGLFDPNADLGGGQLGHGDDRDSYEPKQVMRLMSGPAHFRDLRQSYGPASGGWRAVQVSAARNHSAAIVEVPGGLSPRELGLEQ